jgi:hypothetical protein
MKIKAEHHNKQITYSDGYVTKTVKLADATDAQISEMIFMGIIPKDIVELPKAKVYEGIKKTKSKATKDDKQDTPPTED